MEVIKVLKKRKIGIAVLFLLALQICLFWFQEEDTYAEKPDVTHYVSTFHEEIEQILQASDSMGMISIFAKKDSFSSNNLKQTKFDYEKLLAVEPVAFDGTFLSEFLTDTSMSLLMLLAGLFVVLALDEDNQPGLRSMIFSTSNGRKVIVLWKIRALFILEGAVSTLFLLATLFASCLKYDGNLAECISYPAQSLPMLGGLPWVTSIGGLLLAYWGYRWLVLFVISLCIWCILQYTNHLVLGIGTVAGVGLLNFIVYSLIGPSHSLNILHYCNIYYLIKDAAFFSEYKNLNIWNEAINKNLVIFLVFFLIFIIAVTVALWIGEHKYPYVSKRNRLIGWMEKIQEHIFTYSSRLQEKLSLAGAEFYKLFVIQKGLIILVLVIGIVFLQIDFTEIQRTGSQDLYYSFMESYAGAPTQEAQHAIEDTRKEVEAVEEEVEEAGRLYEAGEIELEDYAMLEKKLDSYNKERVFLQVIDAQTLYIQEMNEKNDTEIWYVNEYSYYHLLEEEKTISNLLLVLAVVLLCSNTFAWEERSGTTRIIRGSAEGRQKFFAHKIKASFSVVTGLFLITTLLQIGSIKYIYGLDNLGAPVQSVKQLAFIDIPCSIGVFIAILYLVKLMMFLAVAGIICGLSVKYKQKTMIEVFGVLCIPSILTWIGFEAFQYSSLTEILSVTSFFLQIRSIGLMMLILSLFAGVSAYCMIFAYKKWCKS